MTIAYHATSTPSSRTRGRPSHDSSTLGRINDQSYRIVDNMRLQAGDLDDISDYNCEEDRTRARLGAILRAQAEALREERVDLRLIADLNRRAQRALALVDALDAAQGLSEIKDSIDSAHTLNRDTAEAGLDILARTEPATSSRRKAA